MDSKEALKIVRNLVKVGQVSSIDPEKGTVKVTFPDKDDIVSDDIPMLNFEYHMPDIEDQVWCLFLGNGLEAGVCLGKSYSEKTLPPANDKDLYKKQIDENMYIQYHKKTKIFNMKVEGVEIEVNKGKVNIKAEEVLIGDGAIEGVPLGDTLKSWLDNHTHPYSWTDPSGSGNTGIPSPSPEPSKKVKTI